MNWGQFNYATVPSFLELIGIALRLPVVRLPGRLGCFGGLGNNSFRNAGFLLPLLRFGTPFSNKNLVAYDYYCQQAPFPVHFGVHWPKDADSPGSFGLIQQQFQPKRAVFIAKCPEEAQNQQ